MVPATSGDLLRSPAIAPWRARFDMSSTSAASSQLPHEQLRVGVVVHLSLHSSSGQESTCQSPSTNDELDGGRPNQQAGSPRCDRRRPKQITARSRYHMSHLIILQSRFGATPNADKIVRSISNSAASPTTQASRDGNSMCSVNPANAQYIVAEPSH